MIFIFTTRVFLAHPFCTMLENVLSDCEERVEKKAKEEKASTAFCKYVGIFSQEKYDILTHKINCPSVPNTSL